MRHFSEGLSAVIGGTGGRPVFGVALCKAAALQRKVPSLDSRVQLAKCVKQTWCAQIAATAVFH
jgi:hypothetical protein